jgi:hypothetical protein
MKWFRWLDSHKLTVRFVVAGPAAREKEMTFKEFTLKYRGGVNPATGAPWTVQEVISNSGLAEATVMEYIAFWSTVQKTTVATLNRMPTNADIILAHDGPSEPVPEPPKVSMPQIDYTQRPRTPYNPVGSMSIVQLTVPQFEELMHHILKEHFEK